MVDPGWLFLLAGLALLGATVLIPAAEDLANARWKRDAALTYERHRLDRLERYQGYLDALDRREPALIMTLAESQLGLMPADRGLLSTPNDSRVRSVSVYPALEPPPLDLPEPRQPTNSRLARWAMGPQRLWLIAAGAVCVLVGLLPAARRRHEPG